MKFLLTLLPLGLALNRSKILREHHLNGHSLPEIGNEGGKVFDRVTWLLAQREMLASRRQTHWHQISDRHFN